MGNPIREVHELEEGGRRFCLPEFSAKRIFTWKFHVDESTNSRYNIILGRDLLTAMGLDLKFSENVIHGVEVPYKGCSEPIIGVNNYDFGVLTGKQLNRKYPLLTRT